jgi:carboxypeptidase Taq
MNSPGVPTQRDAEAATPAYDALVAHHARLHHLSHLQAVATWDRMTHMPPGAAAARAAAQAELAGFVHLIENDASLDGLITRAATEPLGEDDWSNLRLMQRQGLMARAIPETLARRRPPVVAAAMQAWGPAKAANDWPSFAAVLVPLVALVREEAQALSQALAVPPYDALVAQHEPGMPMARIDTLFGDVAGWLPGLVAGALRRQQALPPPIEPLGPFSVAAQRRLCEDVMRLLGFDFEAGRLDTSAHPFTGGVPEDVRLTTRFSESSFLPALLGTIHETGHGRYQQNLPRAWLGQPLAGPHSAALHEGQALCFERQLAPTPAFVALLAPMLRQAFGEQAAFEEGNLVQLLRRVRPGRVRVEADELTYPAHVILRVDIERGLIDGQIEVADIPAVWDEHMQRLLGIDTRGNFSQGPLQDMHWAQGLFGYFPAYLLGAMVAAQCVEALRLARPDLDMCITGGDLSPVGDWLGQHVWQQGARLNTDELLQRATGRPLDASALRRHLEIRHGAG